MPLRNKQFFQVSRLKAPSRVHTTSIELQAAIKTAMSETVIFASASCHFNIITVVRMKMMNFLAFVGNARHF